MAVFEYKARNMEGQLITGDAAAPSAEALEDMLRGRGYYIVDCQERRGAGAGWRGWRGWRASTASATAAASAPASAFSPASASAYPSAPASMHPPARPPATASAVLRGRMLLRKVGPRDTAVLCRQMSVLLNAGVTIVESMSLLKKETENRRLRAVISDVHVRLQRGAVLSEAMGAHLGVFGEFFVNMVRVGEASGTLDAVMDRLADYYERENKVSQKTRSALMYPLILAVLTVAVIALLLVKVLPMFSDILKQMGGSMPGATRAMMAASDFIMANFVPALALVAAAAILVRAFAKSDAGRYWIDAMKLTLPGVRTVTAKALTARFARSLGILLKSGIPIMGAVDILKRMIGNRALERRFEACAAAIKEGRGIAGPIAEMQFFPNLLVHMVTIGENSGELDEMLARTAGFFDLEVEEAIGRLTGMIEPLLIIVLGAVVGFIVLSIMLPMISIMTSI